VHKRSVLWWGGDDSTADLTKLEWVIEAPAAASSGSRRGTSGPAPSGRLFRSAATLSLRRA
jgi:hypothetical protein